ncbi:MAG: Hsp20/alpha crystallin family protein [Tunicatimonas sp.]
MTLVRYNNRFPRFFDDFFTRDLDQLIGGVDTHRNLPAVNVKEDEHGFAVEVAAPGFEKADFKVEVDQDLLTIAAEKEAQGEATDDVGYVKREFRSQTFQRSFRLPENVVDGDKIEARYEAGILYLSLPKREEVKPKPARMIEIG